MGITELLDESAAAALEHANALQRRLRLAAEEESGLAECDSDLHRLIGDIVSLRNAAELLKRALPAS